MSEKELYSQEVEEAFLGAILVRQDLMPIVAPTLTADDFYISRYAKIYDYVVKQYAAGLEFNQVIFFDECIQNDDMDLSQTAMSVISHPANMGENDIIQYAKSIKDKAQRRRVIDAMASSVAAAYDENNPINTVLSKHDANMMTVKKSGASDDGLVDKSVFADGIMTMLADAETNKDKPKIVFPWGDLDKLTGPLTPGTLVGVIAEPGVGKTVFLENCSESFVKSGWNVAMYHFELNTDMMRKRYVQRETGLTVRQQSNGDVGERWGDVIESVKRASEWSGNLFYRHCPGWTAGEVAADIALLNEQHGINVVVIDYFNKISHTDRNGLNAALSREQDIEEIKIALEVHGIVGIMAAQFDKAARKIGGHKSLADAKETSALEDKSNVGIVIRRDKDEDGNRSSETLFSVVKCNAGRDGVVDAIFIGEKYLFVPAVKVNLNE